jgi:hypothetical protein
MTNAKHTPGPWRFNVSDRQPSDASRLFAEILSATVWTPETGVKYATSAILYAYSTGIGGRNLKEAEANARMLAAAPELLKAAELGLENLLAETGNIETEDSVIIRAAIAKATGEAQLTTAAVAGWPEARSAEGGCGQ